MDIRTCLVRLAAAVDSMRYAEAVQALNEYYRHRINGAKEPENGDWIADRAANQLAHALKEEAASQAEVMMCRDR